MRFSKFTVSLAITAVLILIFNFGPAYARALYDIDRIDAMTGKITASNTPFSDIGVHDKGRIGLTITNMGHFGTGFLASTPGDVPSCQYPYPGQQEYLFAGAFWIGAVVGRDTLVSVGADGWQYIREMWPDVGEGYPPYGGAIIERSINNAGDEDAVSEQDFIAVYTDTVTNSSYVSTDPTDGRQHRPLNIEVTQRSYCWSYSYADDFVLFDYSIKNIGRKTLNRVYMGIYVDGDVKTKGSEEGFDDDICGFKESLPSSTGCGFIDTVNIAWISDNDGKQSSQDQCPYSTTSLTAVTATRVVRTPSDSLEYSFNWWISNGTPALDFGPRKAGTPVDPFRDFGGFLGTPEGDRNKYYIMRHKEFDYDQLFCAMDHTSEGWLNRDSQSSNFADGYDTRYLLSFGPFDIEPGEILPISFAYVAGDTFFTDCNAFDNFDAQHPEEYYNTLSFESLGRNAVWASKIYDNPGVDTDGDGENFGKFRICGYDSVYVCHFDTTQFEPETLVDTTCGYEYTNSDTFWYEGDGVPDFRGASPPPPPELWIVDTTGDTLGSKVIGRINDYHQGEIAVRWNGFESETTEDVFSDLIDFEGYRVWISLAPSSGGFSVISSYDIEDYNRWIWNTSKSTWELKETPFRIENLEAIYGTGFNPLNYDRDNPLYWNDTAYYFSRQDWNQSDLLDSHGIHKVYPEVTDPPTIFNIDSTRIYHPEELTDDGLFFKYYEYEYILTGLLPSQLQYVAVTAFDFGSPISGLESLETQPYRNYVAEYPQNTSSIVENEGLDVYVYPNPYRIDGQYKANGFEGRDYIDNKGELVSQEGYPDDRTRSIHFSNLPAKCTIRIFSIDGDLVREIDHDVPAGHPQSSHERWDLITRNTQPIVSGIYYYSVESESGNQIGKIVIIM
nr:hypothetical protein [candidate division Zixibacteria bacterium]